MIGDIRKFKFWCQKVLPLVYDDSLSYYEILCKVVQYLNKVIEDVNSIPEYIDNAIDEKLSDEHLLELIEQFVLNIESAISSNNEGDNTNSSSDYNIGQMLWWNGKLYRVIRPIDAGDTLIEDTNIENVNFEDLFNEFLSEIKDDVTSNDDGTNTTASQNWSAGTWLWLNDALYIVTQNITQGNAYVFSGVNANVAKITIEGELAKEATARSNEDNTLHSEVGNLNNLNTINKTNLVNAINEVDLHADTNSNSIIDLVHNITSNNEAAGATTATINTVAGDWLTIGNILYLVKSTINIGDSYIAGTNIERVRFEERYNTMQAVIGDLSGLTTTDKSSVVNAINEVDSHADANATSIGDLSNLSTTDKDNLVDAINEVAASVPTFHRRYTNILLVMDSYGSRTYSSKYMDELVTIKTGIACKLVYRSGAGLYNGQLNELITNETGTGYDAVIIFAGANDQIHTSDLSTPFATICANIRSKWANADIIVGCCGLTFLTSGSLSTTSMIALAKAYKDGAKENKALYMTNSEYILRNTQLLDSDKIHPNSNGVNALAQFIANWLYNGYVDVDYLIDVTDTNSVPYKMRRHNGMCWLYKATAAGYVFTNNAGTTPFDSNIHELAAFDNTLINNDSSSSGLYPALASNVAFAVNDPRAMCAYLYNNKLYAYLYTAVGAAADTPASFRIVGNSIMFVDETV